ncbi:MAG TPA: hypothetical protein VFQ61_00075 [Polyangiaceae bacterium]|nr:hypothetical protein [Polyangiaceae bacterium]
MASLEGIEAGTRLGPYRVEKRLAAEPRAFFQAINTDAPERPVCLLELRDDEVEAYASAAQRSTQHAHLARVLEVLREEGHALLVFEDAVGTTLTERLAERGKKPEVEAVGSALRIADALSTLHEAGCVHGFVHTDSVIVDPPERLGPVLKFAPIPAEERTFHSPERGETGKPSVADDAWAVAGLLHMMLTGNPPPKDGYAEKQELKAAGVSHEALAEALLHGLHRDAKVRSSDVRPLKRELARWFVEHAGEEPVLVGPHSTAPPPLPELPLQVMAARAPLRVKRRPRFLMLATVGTLIGLVGAWGISALLAKREVRAQRPSSVQAAPEPVATGGVTPVSASAAGPKEIDLSEVPVTGEEQKHVELDKASSCVAGYLPKGAFGKSPDLTWLCEESNPAKGAEKLRAAVVSSAPRGVVTDAMKLFARLGWYDMAAFAVVRAGCCEDVKPLRMHDDVGKSCTDKMPQALDEIAKEVIGGGNRAEALKRFNSSIQCEINQSHSLQIGRAQRFDPNEEAVFGEFVEAIAH